MKNKSYIKRLFLFLGVIITVTILLIGIVIYFYAKTKIQEELVYVNQNSLKQIGKGTSLRLEEYRYLSEKIANDSRIIELLSKQEKRGILEENRQETARSIQKVLDDYVWTFSEFNPLVYSYVLCRNGELYCGSYSDPGEFKTFQGQMDYDTLAGGQREFGFEGSLENPQAKGVYKYTFWVLHEIKDYISGESYGYVILNISEKNLFDTYKELIAEEKNFYVTDREGIIVSEKNKQKIGEFCGIDISQTEINENGHNNIIVDADGKESYFLFYEIPRTGWYLVETIGTSSLLQSFQTIKWFISIILTLVILLLWFILQIFLKAISEPVMAVKGKMEEVSGGNLKVSFEYDKNNEFGEMARAFNIMVNKLSESIKAVKEEEKKKRLAEQDFLRAQINPHFIYNTLSSIRFFVEMNRNEEADDMLYHFSKVLRKSLSGSNDFVTLGTELETIVDYVELQKKRYKDSFIVEFEIPEEIMEEKVPVFILQPIVENAIFHGIHQGQLLRILISGYCKERKLYLRISDNGRGMKSEEVDKLFQKSSSMSKVGVNNVHDRIQLNFGEEYGLKVESTEGEGTTVTFILPIDGEARGAENFDCG